MMTAKRSAGVIVFRKSEKGPLYLILQNSSRPFWDFAKGNIEPDESEEDAAMREMREETGLEKVELVSGFKETMKYIYKFKGELIDKEVVMFLGEEKGEEEVRLSWEHSDHKWVSLDEGKSVMKDKKRDVLEKAQKFLSGR